MLELCLDVCVICGSGELWRPKLQGLLENLASPLVIPYGCRSCGHRQFKLAKLRISSAERGAAREAAPRVTQQKRHVPSAAFLSAAPLAPQLPNRADPIKSAHPAAWRRQKPGFLHQLSIAAKIGRIGEALTRIRRPAIWAVIGVASVEFILQITALAMWYSDRPRPQHLVLCVGDSYTFGTGATASEYSYPSSLGRLLRKKDQPWRVANAGWPDLDSRETALALADHLLHYRPARVYIVVGARDVLTWPKAAPMGLTKSVSYKFPMVWRTALAFQDIAGWWRVKSAQVSESASGWLHVQRLRWNRPFGPSPIGTWLYQGRVVRIRDDGLVRFGDASFLWETEGNQLNLIPTNAIAGQTQHYQWERRKRALFIKGGIFPAGLLLQPIEDGEAQRLDADAVRKAKQQSIDAPPPSSATSSAPDKHMDPEEKLRFALGNAPAPARFFLRSDLTRAYARNGKCSQATAELAQMRSEMDTAEDPEAMVQTYIDTAEFIGEGARALAAARTFAPRYGSNSAIERTIAWESYLNRDFDSAVAASEKALSLAGSSGARAAILNMRGRIFLDHNAQRSLESLIEAYETNGDEFALKSQLDPGLGLYNPELVNVSLDNLKASFDVRHTVHNAMSELNHASTNIGTVLARNLRLMADMVRATGAEVVFVSYPLAKAGRVNEVIRQIATEKNAGLIDVEKVFARHLEITPAEELFEPDGHLTDQGYALVADLVAADVSKRKR